MRLGKEVHSAYQHVEAACRPAEYQKMLMADVYEIEGKARMALDAYTGMPYTLRNLVFSERNDEFPEPYVVTPSLSQDEVVERATNLLKRIRGGLPSELRFDHGAFVRTGSDRGNWYVVWSYLYRGYEVDHASYEVFFNEEYGLVMYRGREVSPPPATEVRVPQDAAETSSIEPQQRFVSEAFNRKREQVVAKSLRTWLKVVCFNNLYRGPAEDEKARRGRLSETRLAWAILRSVVDERGEATRKLEIWVDAATGEILGGEQHYP